MNQARDWVCYSAKNLLKGMVAESGWKAKREKEVLFILRFRQRGKGKAVNDLRYHITLFINSVYSTTVQTDFVILSLLIRPVTENTTVQFY